MPCSTTNWWYFLHIRWYQKLRFHNIQHMFTSTKKIHFFILIGHSKSSIFSFSPCPQISSSSNCNIMLWTTSNLINTPNISSYKFISKYLPDPSYCPPPISPPPDRLLLAKLALSSIFPPDTPSTPGSFKGNGSGANQNSD